MLICLSFALRAESPGELFFETKVRPLLAQHCAACHTQTKMGGLAITSKESLLKGGKSGPAVRVGAPEESLLWKAVRYDGNLQMPPSGKLQDGEIATLHQWIKDGADWPISKVEPAPSVSKITDVQRAWWSFQPIRKPAVPTVANRTWARTPIDAFLLQKMEAKQVAPNKPADRRTLLRRVSIDLIGLPPTAEEVAAFVNDKSPNAYAKVVDRLLASPHYGERWGRHWLDVARYADERLNSTADEPIENAWRYRDWVVQAFNDDMPYNLFLKAQIAGDTFPAEEREKYVGGLGFFALSPEQQDDRVDAMTRGMLGLTVACAQCHDHKFDPIPTRDYYSLQGIFRNTKGDMHPLVDKQTVDFYNSKKEAHEKAQKKLDDYMNAQALQLAEIFAGKAAVYLQAAGAPADAAETSGLDKELVERWRRYLKKKSFEHAFLKGWNEPGFSGAAFSEQLLRVFARQREIERENMIALGGKDDGNSVRVIEVKALAREDYYLYRDFFHNNKVGPEESGLLYFKGKKLDRFLSPEFQAHAEALRATADAAKKQIPDMYPYYQTVGDVEKLKTSSVEIKGNRDNLGEVAPPQFLEVLAKGERKPFTKGSGRQELADAVADPGNPLPARVIANRIWLGHFGRGLSSTPGNFGRLGEKPSHPELLEYLAARLQEQNWSIKALHREIVNSAVYQLQSDTASPSQAIDSGNALYWRWTPRRMDAEPLRDSLLFVTGELDLAVGGKPEKIEDDKSRRRTLYGSVSRRRLDGTLALFDFPNPIATSEQRIQTATPLQQLFFLNSTFIEQRAKALAERTAKTNPKPADRIQSAYQLLFQRQPDAKELSLALEYIGQKPEKWVNYMQALLGTNEMLFVN